MPENLDLNRAEQGHEFAPDLQPETAEHISQPVPESGTTKIDLAPELPNLQEPASRDDDAPVNLEQAHQDNEQHKETLLTLLNESSDKLIDNYWASQETGLDAPKMGLSTPEK